MNPGPGAAGATRDVGLPAQVLEYADSRTGLDAILVIDDTTLGPAAGGVRTRAYPTRDAARADALGLARAMTIKCALAGLAAGGGKCVVIDHPGLDRPRAFEALGRWIQAQGGRFRTAGDLGTTAADLAAMAAHTEYVHGDGIPLAEAVGRGLSHCAEAAARALGAPGLAGFSVAVQGAGAIGEATARALAHAGARVSISDLDGGRAHAVAAAIGASVVAPERILETEVDLLAPCATGGVVSPEVARRLKARILCGAANNILSEPEVAEILRERGRLHVPDVIASAGAVIEGIGRTVMRLADRTPLIEALGATTAAVLAEAKRSGRTADAVALELAEARIAAARARAR